MICRHVAVDLRKEQKTEAKSEQSEKHLLFSPLTLRISQETKEMSKDKSFCKHIFEFVEDNDYAAISCYTNPM